LIGLKAFAGAAKLLGKSYRSRITCGIGIGVGTFTVDSDKFRTKSLQLGEMKRLYVRDNVSIDNLSALGYSGHVEVSSDLAFLRNYWLKPASRDKANQVSRVGFVLRDWTKNNSDYLENVASWIYDLRKEGIGCNIISFDQQHDKTIVEWSRSNQFELISWDPFKKRISDFCESLSGYDLIITSRAHGAIMAGCLGIPCMIIHLEDKLLQISKMFPTSMQLVNTDETVGELRSLMKSYITNFDDSRLASEVENNENKIQKSIQELTSFIKTA
jgi:polysaccharide pyruvyl transferase WcaK-like protein